MTADEEALSCNFLATTVIDASTPAGPNGLGPSIRKWGRPVYRQVRTLLAPRVTTTVAEERPVPEIPPLYLEPGDWVEVRPIEEINATLDGAKKYKGLYFMPEMAAYCGGRYRVFRRVETIKLESTGEVRRLRSPTVFLEGVYCDGKRHQGCDRACFHFWREAWLKGPTETDASQIPSTTGAGT